MCNIDGPFSIAWVNVPVHIYEHVKTAEREREREREREKERTRECARGERERKSAKLARVPPSEASSVMAARRTRSSMETRIEQYWVTQDQYIARCRWRLGMSVEQANQAMQGAHKRIEDGTIFVLASTSTRTSRRRMSDVTVEAAVDAVQDVGEHPPLGPGGGSSSPASPASPDLDPSSRTASPDGLPHTINLAYSVNIVEQGPDTSSSPRESLSDAETLIG